jgi:hypothetical protein
MAFRDDFALPSSERGPVLCWELARLALSWASETGRSEVLLARSAARRSALRLALREASATYQLLGWI